MVLLFACCFAAVVIFKLAKIGFESLKPKPPAEEKKPPKQEKAQKPVYYIVEKKRTRGNYGAPRKINFSDDDK